MVAFIVHSNPADDRARLLSDLLGQLGHDATFVDTLDAVGQSREVNASQTLVLVPDAEPNGMLAERAIQFAAEKQNHAFVVYIADSITADQYKALVRTEAGEWVRWSSISPELLDVLQRRQSRATRSVDSGKVASFMGGSGGVGNTTLAVETAVHLLSAKGKKGRRVCLLDLNFQYSAVSEYLEIEPRLAIAEIADRPERIDQQIIDIFTSTHSSGLHVFSSPPSRIDYAGIDEKVIFALLDFIARRYDVVVVDLPTFWLPWSGNIILGSDVMVVTGVYNVPSVKQSASRMSQLDELGVAPDRTSIVVNQCASSLFGGIVRRSDVESALAGRRVFYVQRDIRLANEAVNTGRPMVQVRARSKVSKDIGKVAAWLDSSLAGQGTETRKRVAAAG